MGMWRGMIAAVAVAVAMVVSINGAGSPAVAQEPQPARVRVVHGLRGLVADVYLDGDLVLPTFQPERSTDPLSIPPGAHDIEIRPAGASLRSTPLLAQRVDVPAGFDGSLVAHLDTDGDPVLTAFADDTTAVPAGQSRIVVRHTADVGPVNVTLGGSTPFGSMAPQRELARVVGAAPYELSVTAGGDTVVTPQGVDLQDGTVNFMYLIGSRADDSLGWAAVKVRVEPTPPAMIHTGDGSSLPASGGPHPAAVVFAIAAGAAALTAAGLGLTSRARRLQDP